MIRHRDLLVADGLAVLVLLAVLLIGWWDAAAFGLAVLVIMNLIVVLRQRSAHGDEGGVP